VLILKGECLESFFNIQNEMPLENRATNTEATRKVDSQSVRFVMCAASPALLTELPSATGTALPSRALGAQ